MYVGLGGGVSYFYLCWVSGECHISTCVGLVVSVICLPLLAGGTYISYVYLCAHCAGLVVLSGARFPFSSLAGSSRTLHRQDSGVRWLKWSLGSSGDCMLFLLNILLYTLLMAPSDYQIFLKFSQLKTSSLKVS